MSEVLLIFLHRQKLAELFIIFYIRYVHTIDLPGRYTGNIYKKVTCLICLL